MRIVICFVCRPIDGIAKVPFLSARHCKVENTGVGSPGPVYHPDMSCTLPAAASPTMLGRGRDVWTALEAASR